MDVSENCVGKAPSVPEFIHNDDNGYQKTELDVYVALHYSLPAYIISGSTVSLTANLFHAASAYLTAAPLAEVARSVFDVAAVGGLLMFFRPLLTGIGRALVLTVRPRRARKSMLRRDAA